jgi:hypothetical protein
MQFEHVADLRWNATDHAIVAQSQPTEFRQQANFCRNASLIGKSDKGGGAIAGRTPQTQKVTRLVEGRFTATVIRIATLSRLWTSDGCKGTSTRNRITGIRGTEVAIAAQRLAWYTVFPVGITDFNSVADIAVITILVAGALWKTGQECFQEADFRGARADVVTTIRLAWIVAQGGQGRFVLIRT